MAEVISNFISKRRNRSSGSEGEEANEPKKLRNTVHENESQIAESEEDQNVIVIAPEMTVDVASKLEVILVKLNNIEVDCDKILSLGFRLRDTDFQMYRDLPREIVTRRKAQMAILKESKAA